jgi:F-type H+-transporting ATPase subunit gamma
MGAAGLIEIKRRLKSVESTKKITKAMGLVATSKLRKSRKELSINNQFADIAKDNVQIVYTNSDGDVEVPYLKSDGEDITLYIVITSDAGLCGGYNNNIVSYLQSIVSSDKKNIRVISVGSKGISYLKKAGFSTIAEYVDISDVPTIKEVDIIYKKIIKLCVEQNISKVNIVYSEFFSPVKSVVKSEQIMPLEKTEDRVGAELIEPNLEIVFKDTFDIYFKSKLRSCILSAKCSEQSSRMTAMDGATSNAEDIISSLNTKYNRIRQSIITQEISEIVGGAEAQK